MRSCRAIVLVPLLLLGCKTVTNENPLQFETAPLFGMIYDLDNKPCAGVSVRVDGLPGETSDIDGRFVLPGLKRGPHSVRASAENHEPLEVRFSFDSRTQVLYLKMVSFDQLLALAQGALDGKRWADADLLLKRASALNESDAVLLYLQAILDYRQGDPAAAERRLSSLVDSGRATAPVFLFLADLYQYSLGQPASARRALDEYLRQAEDADVRTRLESLRVQQE